VLRQHVLQLDRVDVLAARDDHVVHPAAEEEFPLLIAVREVAGLDPVLLAGRPRAPQAEPGSRPSFPATATPARRPPDAPRASAA
jgi:hypothetical protein